MGRQFLSPSLSLSLTLFVSVFLRWTHADEHSQQFHLTKATEWAQNNAKFSENRFHHTVSIFNACQKVFSVVCSLFAAAILFGCLSKKFF